MSGTTNDREVGQIVEQTFRREFARMVAILTAQFGLTHLHRIEDAVQESLLKAMRSWPLNGIPQNPSAWLLQSARNHLFDFLRRENVLRRHEHLPDLQPSSTDRDGESPYPHFPDEVGDAQLRMMFVCCHPALTQKSQVTLALRTLCGFGENEIAAAFLESEDAVKKRLVRTRQLLREQGVTLDLPTPDSLSSRVNAILQTLYLLFNEGYKASLGDALVRRDLCDEALRLGNLLVQHPVGDRPDTHALLALMYFGAGRFDARLGSTGALIPLAEQDRTSWDSGKIGRGIWHLDRATSGTTLSRYHLEAAIAACHVTPSDFASTNWRRIVQLYHQLCDLDPSPMVKLNRAVALAQVDGPSAGLAEIAALHEDGTLENHHLLHAVEGQFWLEAGERARAASAFRRALELVRIPAERALLQQKLERFSE